VERIRRRVRCIFLELLVCLDMSLSPLSSLRKRTYILALSSTLLSPLLFS
jgi:hypothetical protein